VVAYPGYDSCAATGTASSMYSNCDTEGFVTTYECAADATCTTCTIDQAYSTSTCTVEGDYGYKAVCGADASDDTCFSGDDAVTLASGESKRLADVQVGDEVLTADATDAFSFAAVVALPHARNNKVASFVNVATASGKSVKATKLHLLRQCDGSLAYAGSLAVGDCLRTVDGNEAVTAVSMTKAEGVFTAVTTNEFLVVNGIVASPFAVSHDLASAYYTLHRAVAKVFPAALKSPLAAAANALVAGAFFASSSK